MSRIVSIVAPNGVGHARRSIGMLARLRSRVPDLRITLVCEDWQLRAFDGWNAAARVIDGARIVHGVTAPGVSWLTQPDGYADGRLLAWEDRLRSSGALDQADLVLSDNLTGVLTTRPDAVLAGSFLWSDVLGAAFADDPCVRAFVEHERELLDVHRPPMLCVGDVAMPGVLERTEAVSLPWMCEPRETVLRSNREPRVAMLGGGTHLADDILRSTVPAVRGRRWISVGPPSLGTDESLIGPGDLARVAAAVCRPGLGAVHDCIAHEVPMVMVYEPGNTELAHTARRLQSMGLAFDSGPEPRPETIVDALETVMDPSTSRSIRSAMRGLPRDGLERAADWLASRLGATTPAATSGKVT